MSESHFLYIWNESLTDLIIAVIRFFIIRRRSHPAGEMNFIHTPWLIQRVVLFARFHPVLIFPGIVKIPGDGCCFGSLFPKMSERIAFYGFCIIESANM